MVSIRRLLLCTARGFPNRVRVSTTAASNAVPAATATAGFSSTDGSSSTSSPSSSSSSSSPSSSSSATSSPPPPQQQQPPRGYGRYVPQRFQRYTSGSAVGDYNMFKKAFVRHNYAEFHKLPMAQKWEGIMSALKPLGRISTGNTFTAYYDTGDAYRAMWGSVDEAKSSVKWATYICKDDAVGKDTIGRIEAAHDRGVQVELLYDCGGNITGRTRLTQGLRHRGANVIRYRPFWLNMYRYYRNGMSWQHSPALRSHRKILIVDDKVGYAGGLNIGDDYCAKSAGGNGRFRDTQCRVDGPAVADLLDVYNDTIHPAPHALSPWRSITAASARKRMQYLKAKARRGLSYGSSATTTTTTVNADGSTTTTTAAAAPVSAQQRFGRYVANTTFHSATVGATNTLRRMKESVKRRGQMMRQYKFRAPKFPSGAGAAPTRVEFARGLYFIKTQAHTLLSSTASAVGKGAVTATHKAVDAVEHTLENVVNAATDRQLYALPATDDQPIPEAKVFEGTPPTTQVIMCNPLTLDWSLPMAMWLVTQDAHRRVWVTTPYYLPHRKLTAAIINTARRGVDVRIVAGSRNTTDPWFMWYASQYVTLRFLQAGVRVYEFEGGQIMHAKTVVVDSVWSSVGSYNWDVLSNKLLEVSVTTFGTEEAAQMEDHFRRDLAKSREITLEEFMNRSLVRKVQCAIFYYGMRFCEWLSFWNYYDPQISTKQE